MGSHTTTTTGPIKRSSLPLSRVMLLSLGSLILIAGGSVLLLLRSTSEHLLLDVGSRGLLRTMDLVEAIVRGQLEPARLQAEALANVIAQEEFDESIPENFKRLFQGALASAPQIRALLFCDDQLRVVSAGQIAGRGNIEFDVFDGSQIQAYQHVDAEMRNAALSSSWGDLVDGKVLNRTLLNVRYPVRRNGMYHGAVVAAVTTREMSRVLAAMEDSLGTSTFLMFGKATIVAHPDLAKRHQSKLTDQLSQQMGTRNPRNDIHVSRAAQEADTTDVNPFGYGKAETFDFKMGDSKYIGIKRSLDDYGNPPLAIGAYFKANLVGAPMQLLYSAALIGLFVLGLAVCLAAWVSRVLTAQIRRVSQGFTQIGQFNITDVQEMSSSRIREVDDMAVSFNRMVSALRSFSTYVPRKLANLVVQGKMGATVTSEERVLTVMFTDIVGFTQQSEGMKAAEVASFINAHLSLLASCVEETGGTIDKYIGDALMAFWGAPDQVENTANAACRAAQLMERRLHEDNERRMLLGQKAIRVRIGIHTGPLVVGNIGAPGRINYTVVGDTVNVAQRLESLGKEVDPQAEVIVLLSSATAQQVSADIRCRDEGKYQLPGKARDVAVARLILEAPENRNSGQ